MCPYCKDRKRYSGVGPCICTVGTGEPRRAATVRLPKHFKERHEHYPGDTTRPKTRGECADVPRPCPFVSCRHHLYLDVVGGNSIKFNFPHLEPHEMKESCVLDVADRHGATLEEVGELRNVTRERVRQVEVAGLVKLSKARKALGDD